jgi:hypothetical protein
MLSYKKCIELRDNGFPQPEYAAGQNWYVKHGGNEDELGLTFPAVLVPESGSASLFVAVDVRNYGHRLPINPFSLVSMAYCPTVEDMLSMLKPAFGIQRSGSGKKWLLMQLTTGHPVYVRESLIEMLSDAWIKRRDLFEDIS